MTTEWARERVAVMKRNSAIQGRNRFFEQLNAWFGTKYPPMPLEPMPSARHVDEPNVPHETTEAI